MPSPNFAADLAAHGPAATAARAATAAEARAYCRDLARRHYENFTVASWLLPRGLRQHFYHVYSYCRWADDLADEVEGRDESLALLDWWQRELDGMYAGEARHPVFVALGQTVREFGIPRQPFADLLVAFRQDQRVTRYETFDDLLGYCRNSACPVGRLVLYLGRAHDEPRGQLADSVCIGLQLANFWQDVADDWNRGRVYLPLEICRRAGYDEAMFAGRQCNQAFRRMLADEVDRAEGYLRAGLPLVSQVPKNLRLDVELFARGGLAILAKIREVDFDVWTRRPELSKREKLSLAWKCWWGKAEGK